jgi:DNA-binding Lrp family transcriptional regulator
VENENLEAYVLVNAEPDMIWQVAEVMLKIEGVKMAHAVTGQFDAVAYVEFVKMEDLGKIIEKIQHLKGVHRTQTLMAIPPTIRK